MLNNSATDPSSGTDRRANGSVNPEASQPSLRGASIRDQLVYKLISHGMPPDIYGVGTKANAIHCAEQIIDLIESITKEARKEELNNLLKLPVTVARYDDIGDQACLRTSLIMERLAQLLGEK